MNIRENLPAELEGISSNSTELCEFNSLPKLPKFQLLRLILSLIRPSYQNYKDYISYSIQIVTTYITLMTPVGASGTGVARRRAYLHLRDTYYGKVPTIPHNAPCTSDTGKG